ncbi:hypothetical protein ACWC2T_39220 [Streptomyces sp. NPDC001393]
MLVLLVTAGLGLAPGPAATGALADRFGLLGVPRLVPLVAVVATMAFLVGRHWSERDLLRLVGLARKAESK